MTDASSLRRGFLLALAGFALLSLGDAVVKTMAGAWPGTGVVALRFAMGAVGLGALLAWREGKAGFRAVRWGLQIARGASLAFASLMFFLAIFVMPLAEATAIQFASPLLTALVSAGLIHERPTRAALIATLVAFAGVLIVLRPNVALLGWAALLPLGSAVGMAFMMTFNRMAAKDSSPLAAQFFIAVFAVPFLLVAALVGHLSGLESFAIGLPPLSVVARCALVAVSASIAHGLVYAATRHASSASIAPAVYVQIIAATLLGVLWFGDWPDWAAIVGTAITIGAGLWLWYRSRDLAVGSVDEMAGLDDRAR